MSDWRQIGVGVIGFAVGSLPGGFGVLAGAQYGLALGGLLFPQAGPKQTQGLLDEIRVNGVGPGQPWPRIWGRWRVAGNLLWTSAARSSSDSSGGGKGRPQVETITYYVDVAAGFCEGPVHSVRRIWMNREVVMDNRTGTATYADWVSDDDFEIYLGSTSQSVNSLMAASSPSDETPAYRGRAYGVFHNVSATRFGGSIPQIEAEVQFGENVTLERVCLDLAVMMGWVEADCDFAVLSGVVVRGAAILRRMEAAEFWRALQDAYLFDVVEIAGKLTAVKWDSSVVGAVSADEIGLDGDADQVTLLTAQSQEVPRRFEIRYITESGGFEPFIQSAGAETADTDEKQLLELPFVLTKDEAAQLAMIHLLRRRLGLTGQVRGLPSLLRFEPGQKVTLPTQIGDLTVKILSMRLAEEGHVEMEVMEDDPSIYSQSGIVGVTEPTGSGGVVSANAEWWAKSDIPAPFDSMAEDYPMLLVSASSGLTTWPGGQLAPIPFRDWARRWEFSPRPVTVSGSRVIGTTTSALAYGRHEVWDRTNTVDVQLVGGTLASVSELEAFNGLNTALIGDEIVVFRTVTQLGDGQYRLSNLIRGARGTEDKILSPRATGAKFVLLNGVEAAGIYGPWDLPQLQEFTQSVLATGIADPFDIVLTDGTLRPLSPVDLRIEVLGGGDRRLTWFRRVRRLGDVDSGIEAPLDQDSEAYAIYVGTGTLSAGTRFSFSTAATFGRGVTSDGLPDLTTALTSSTVDVPSAQWPGAGGRVAVCQIGIKSAQQYMAFGQVLHVAL